MRPRVTWILRSALALFVGTVLGAGGLAFGSVLLLIAALLLSLGGFELTPAVTIVLSLVFIQGIGCIGVGLTYVAFHSTVTGSIRKEFDLSHVRRRFHVDADVPDRRDVAVVVVGYVLALLAAFVGTALVSQLQVDTGTNQAVETALEAPAVLLILIPASILLIGPGEELLFRGVVQGRLRELFSPVSGIIAASVIFAGLHWFALSGGSPLGNLAAVGVLLGPAFVLGAAYEYTDNIVVPSLIHGLYNATLFTLLYVSIAYSDELEEAASGVLSSPL